MLRELRMRWILLSILQRSLHDVESEGRWELLLSLPWLKGRIDAFAENAREEESRELTEMNEVQVGKAFLRLAHEGYIRTDIAEGQYRLEDAVVYDLTDKGRNTLSR